MERVLYWNAIWLLAQHVLGRGSLVVAAIMLSRSLSTEDFAAYAFFQLTAAMFAAYVSFGAGTAATRFFAEADPESGSDLPPVGELWILSVGVSVLMALAILALPLDGLKGGLEISSVLLALCVFVLALDTVPYGGLLGLERYRAATVSAGISATVLLTGAAIAASQASSALAILALIASASARLVCNATLTLGKIGLGRLRAATTFTANRVRRVAGFAGPMALVSMIAITGPWAVGRIVLGGAAGELGFAQYAIGLQWYALALLIPAQISRVVFPRLVRMRSENNRAGTATRQRLVRTASRMSLAAALATAVGGTLFALPIQNMYGTEIQISTLLIAAFLVAAVPTAPVASLTAVILTTDRQWLWLRITSIWFAILITSAFFFTPMGAYAGAVGLCLAGLVQYFMTLNYAHVGLNK